MRLVFDTCIDLNKYLKREKIAMSSLWWHSILTRVEIHLVFHIAFVDAKQQTNGPTK